MAYKLLGLAVWRGARWYVRRRYSGVARKAAVGVVSAAALGGVIVAGRSVASGD
jgi:hypothetical protein